MTLEYKINLTIYLFIYEHNCVHVCMYVYAI